jgi:hypothetical protein
LCTSFYLTGPKTPNRRANIPTQPAAHRGRTPVTPPTHPRCRMIESGTWSSPVMRLHVRLVGRVMSRISMQARGRHRARAAWAAQGKLQALAASGRLQPLAASGGSEKTGPFYLHPTQNTCNLRFLYLCLYGIRGSCVGRILDLLSLGATELSVRLCWANTILKVSRPPHQAPMTSPCQVELDIASLCETTPGSTSRST